MTPRPFVCVEEVEPDADLSTPARALTYLGEALAEYDPACLAYALAAVAKAHGICLLAIYPQAQKENAPGGAFVGLPDQFRPQAGEGPGPLLSCCLAQRNDVVDFRVQFGATLG